MSEYRNAIGSANFKYKVATYKYRNSHLENKAVPGPSYLFYDPYTWDDCFWALSTAVAIHQFWYFDLSLTQTYTWNVRKQYYFRKCPPQDNEHVGLIKITTVVCIFNML